MAETQNKIQEINDLASSVLIALCDRYQNDKEFITKTFRQKGLIHECVGSVSILLIVNSFQSINKTNSWEEIVVKEFHKVYDYLKTFGYDASPFIDESLTAKMFSPKASHRYYYMDSASWVLSFCLLLRLASRSVLSRPPVLALSKSTYEKIQETVQQTLKIIVEGSCRTGGWGFSNECTKPDLFYSYAVSGSLADFGDYVLGESPEIAERDEEFLRFLGEELIAKVQKARDATYLWLKSDFLPQLSREPINPFSENKEDEQPRFPQHNCLYYTYFIIDMLIGNSYTHMLDSDWESVKKAIEHGIYLSRIALDRAKEDTKYWNDPDASSLELRWNNHPDLSKVSNRAKPPKEPGIVPLSLRCNIQYTYYIAGGEDNKISELYDFVRNNRHEETLLWDRDAYDLIVTERAIEALVDYYDYLNKFGTLASSEPVTIILSPIDDAIREMVTREIQGQLSAVKAFGVVEQPEKQQLNERELLEVLISAMASARIKLTTKEDKMNIGSHGNAFFDELKTMLAFSTNIFLEERFPNCHEKEKRLLKKRWNEDLIKLVDAVGGFLQFDPDWDLGQIFKWIVEKHEKDIVASGQKKL